MDRQTAQPSLSSSYRETPATGGVVRNPKRALDNAAKASQEPVPTPAPAAGSGAEPSGHTAEGATDTPVGLATRGRERTVPPTRPRTIQRALLDQFLGPPSHRGSDQGVRLIDQGSVGRAGALPRQQSDEGESEEWVNPDELRRRDLPSWQMTIEDQYPDGAFLAPC